MRTFSLYFGCHFHLHGYFRCHSPFLWYFRYPFHFLGYSGATFTFTFLNILVSLSSRLLTLYTVHLVLSTPVLVLLQICFYSEILLNYFQSEFSFKLFLFSIEYSGTKTFSVFCSAFVLIEHCHFHFKSLDFDKSNVLSHASDLESYSFKVKVLTISKIMSKILFSLYVIFRFLMVKWKLEYEKWCGCLCQMPPHCNGTLKNDWVSQP